MDRPGDGAAHRGTGQPVRARERAGARGRWGATLAALALAWGMACCVVASDASALDATTLDPGVTVTVGALADATDADATVGAQAAPTGDNDTPGASRACAAGVGASEPTAGATGGDAGATSDGGAATPPGSTESHDVTAGADADDTDDTGDNQGDAGTKTGADEEDPSALEVTGDAPAITIGVNRLGTDGTATVEVVLAPGTKTAPGVFVMGDGVRRVQTTSEETTEGTSEHVTITTDATGAVTMRVMADGRGCAAQVRLWLDEKVVAHRDLDGSAPRLRMRAMRAPAAGGWRRFACSGYYDNTTQPTADTIARITDADTGEVAYCNNMNLWAPADPHHGSSEPVTYGSWSFPSDPAEAMDSGQNLLDFILFHGYPIDPTVGGRCPDAQDAQAATQWAIWYYTNVGCFPTDQAPADAWSAGFWGAFDYLIQGAGAYDAARRGDPGAFHPEAGTCLVWTSGDDQLQSLLTAQPRWGWVDVQKLSGAPELTQANAAYSLAGATFVVAQADGTVVATMTTDERGAAGALVPCGSLSVTETVAPPGFVAAEPQTAEVHGGPVHVALDVVDPPVLGGLTVEKRASSSDGGPLAGATFEVRRTADGATVATIVTDASGVAHTGQQALPLGDYVLVETDAPAGYLTCDPLPFSVTGDDTQVNLRAVDPPATYDVAVLKASAVTGAPLAGATFELLAPTDAATDVTSLTHEAQDADAWRTVATARTGDDGIMTLSEVPAGAYLLRETVAPVGFALPHDGVALIVAPDGAVTARQAGLPDAPAVSLRDDGTVVVSDAPVPQTLPSAGGTTLPRRIALVLSLASIGGLVALIVRNARGCGRGLL